MDAAIKGNEVITTAIQSVYRPDITGIKVIEWKTKKDEKTHKEYHGNRAYIVHLYTNHGNIENYNSKRTLDVRA